MSNTSVCVCHDCVVCTECATGTSYFPHSSKSANPLCHLLIAISRSKSDVTFDDVNVGTPLKDLQSVSLGVAMVAEAE